jgi:hypothetical protein
MFTPVLVCFDLFCFDIFVFSMCSFPIAAELSAFRNYLSLMQHRASARCLNYRRLFNLELQYAQTSTINSKKRKIPAITRGPLNVWVPQQKRGRKPKKKPSKKKTAIEAPCKSTQLEEDVLDLLSFSQDDANLGPYVCLCVVVCVVVLCCLFVLFVCVVVCALLFVC